VNPGENLGIWLVLLVGFVAVTGWNISRLAAVRPALDRLVAVLGGVAILAVVIGASLVVTEVTECTFAASSLTCSPREILLVAAMDAVASAALITAWLRTDACRAPFAAVRVRAIPKTRRQRAVAGIIRA
jgi:hypothetical protein